MVASNRTNEVGRIAKSWGNFVEEFAKRVEKSRLGRYDARRLDIIKSINGAADNTRATRLADTFLREIEGLRRELIHHPTTIVDDSITHITTHVSNPVRNVNVPNPVNAEMKRDLATAQAELVRVRDEAQTAASDAADAALRAADRLTQANDAAQTAATDAAQLSASEATQAAAAAGRAATEAKERLDQVNAAAGSAATEAKERLERITGTARTAAEAARANLVSAAETAREAAVQARANLERVTQAAADAASTAATRAAQALQEAKTAHQENLAAEEKKRSVVEDERSRAIEAQRAAERSQADANGVMESTNAELAATIAHLTTARNERDQSQRAAETATRAVEEAYRASHEASTAAGNELRDCNDRVLAVNAALENIRLQLTAARRESGKLTDKNAVRIRQLEEQLEQEQQDHRAAEVAALGANEDNKRANALAAEAAEALKSKRAELAQLKAITEQRAQDQALALAQEQEVRRRQEQQEHQKLQSAEQKLEAMQRSAAESAQLSEQQQAALRAAEEATQMARAAAEDSAQKVEEAKQHATATGAQMAELVAKHEAASAALQHRNSELEDAARVNSPAMHELTSTHDELVRENTVLRSDAAEHTTKIEQAAGQVDLARRQTVIAEEKLAEAAEESSRSCRQDLRKCSDEKERLAERLHGMEEQAVGLNGDLENAQVELTEVHAALAEAQGTADALNTEMKRAEEEITTLKNALRELDAMRARMKEIVDGRDARETEIAARHAANMRQLREATDFATRIRSQLEKSQRRIAELAPQLKARSERVRDLNNELRIATTERDRLREAAARCGVTEEANETLRHRVREARQELQEVKASVAKLSASNAQLTEQVRVFPMQKSASEERLIRRNKKYGELTRELNRRLRLRGNVTTVTVREALERRDEATQMAEAKVSESTRAVQERDEALRALLRDTHGPQMLPTTRRKIMKMLGMTEGAPLVPPRPLRPIEASRPNPLSLTVAAERSRAYDRSPSSSSNEEFDAARMARTAQRKKSTAHRQSVEATKLGARLAAAISRVRAEHTDEAAVQDHQPSPPSSDSGEDAEDEEEPVANPAPASDPNNPTHGQGEPVTGGASFGGLGGSLLGPLALSALRKSGTGMGMGVASIRGGHDVTRKTSALGRVLVAILTLIVVMLVLLMIQRRAVLAGQCCNTCRGTTTGV